MFVNLDYSENLDFIYKWKDSLDPLIDALVNQEETLDISVSFYKVVFALQIGIVGPKNVCFKL